MENTFLNRYFDCCRIGYAYLSAEQSVLHCNNFFREYLSATEAVTDSGIRDLIPELIGMEHIMEKISSGDEFSFSIDNINRDVHKRETIYLNLSLYSLEQAQTPLLCLIENVTDKSSMLRENKQKVNHRQLQCLSSEIAVCVEPESEPVAPSSTEFRIPSEGIAFTQVEEQLLKGALKLAKGNKSRAAHLLRMSRDTFRYRLTKYAKR